MRWEGLFFTPNLAALVLSSILLCLITLSVVVRTSHRGRYLAGIIWLASLPAIGLLASTQSRAGILALLAGAIILAWRGLLCRRWLALWLITFIVAFALHPAVIMRAVSGLEGDLSTTTRWHLWYATLSLIGDHPWSGVGMHKLPIALEVWYLAPFDLPRFGSALNDVLTITAAWGIPVAFVILSLVLSLVHATCSRIGPPDWILILGGSLTVALIVSGCFQFHLVWYWWWVIALIALGLLAIGIWRNMRSINWTNNIVWGSVGAAAIMLALFSLGKMCAMTHPYQTWAEPTGSIVGTLRNVPPWGLIYYREERVSPLTALTSINVRRLRALADSGSAVGLIESWEDLVQITHASRSDVYYVCEGQADKALLTLPPSFPLALVCPQVVGGNPENARSPDLVVTARFSPTSSLESTLRIWPASLHLIEEGLVIEDGALGGILRDWAIRRRQSPCP